MKNVFCLSIILLISFSCKDSYCPNLGLELVDSKVLCTNCQSPNLHKVGSDKLLITYIQNNPDNTDALIFHTLEKGILSEPTIINKGDNWFVNWADIPSIVSMDKNGKNLMAHWLQMSADGKYDYDIMCSISNDKGLTWNSPFILHDDDISAEHGFATMVTSPKGTFVTWLDGRNTKTLSGIPKETKSKSHEHGHQHSDNLSMTLRSAWINKNGDKIHDTEIDNKVCDCCQTDAIQTSSGPIVIYRDRSDDEVRDISIAKYVKEKWITKSIHKDNWILAGCPVNGPAAAYKNGKLAVVWYTQMNTIPKVFLAFSNDDGNTFSDPILIAEDNVIGRVDVTFDFNNDVIVTWTKEENEETFIYSRIFSNHLSSLIGAQKLLKTTNERASGFPIIEYHDRRLYMVRTKTEGENLSVVFESFDGP